MHACAPGKKIAVGFDRWDHHVPSKIHGARAPQDLGRAGARRASLRAAREEGGTPFERERGLSSLVRGEFAVTAVHGKIKFYLFLLRASRVTRESARWESARSFRPLNRPSPTCPYSKPLEPPSICGIAKLGIRTRGFVRGTCERVRTSSSPRHSRNGRAPRLGQPCGRCAPSMPMRGGGAYPVAGARRTVAGWRLPQCHSLAKPPTKHLAS